MSAPFYARYFPPGAASKSQSSTNGNSKPPASDKHANDSGRKRKRDHDEQLRRDEGGSGSRSKDKSVKRTKDKKKDESKDDHNGKSRKSSHSDKESRKKRKQEEADYRKSNGAQKTEKDDSSNHLNGLEEESNNHQALEETSRDVAYRDVQESKQDSKLRYRKERTQKRKHISGVDEDETSSRGTEEPSNHTKHATVLSKFERSIQHQPPQLEPQPKDDEVDVNELVPIPIPEPTSDINPPAPLTVLPPWLSKPLVITPDGRLPFSDLPLDSKLVEKLLQKGFAECLPIQSGLLPLLLPSASQHPGDLCVSAATGSGKTLGYVLPIIQSLSTQVPTQLRALIVVPTRELVKQVQQTAEMCAAGTSLRVGVAVGSKSLQAEQSSLVRRSSKYDPEGYKAIKTRMERQARHETDEEDTSDQEAISLRDFQSLLPHHVPEYRSTVDILIATPGRLVEHVKSNKQFSLSNLQWLVIDEADRLLHFSFYEWVETVFAAIEPQDLKSANGRASSKWLNLKRSRPIRKIVLSATMTRDLEKLGDLRLNNPRMVVLEGEKDQSNGEDANTMELPLTLYQFGIPVNDGSEKPLYLLALLSHIMESDSPGETKSARPKKAIADAGSDGSSNSVNHSTSDDESASDTSKSETSDSETHVRSSNLSSNALIFTSSNEATNRLAQLLVRLRPGLESTLATITKSSASKKTQKILSSFRSSKLRLLIATDRASRGIDLTNLENVINYDIPHSITSYVHRVGRTARAGREGTSWTLIQDREAGWFWKELAKGDKIHMTNGGVVKKRFDLSVLDSDIKEQYGYALAELEEQVKGKK